MSNNPKNYINKPTRFLKWFFVSLLILILCFITVILALFDNFNTSNPKKYNKALNEINRQEKILHFPKFIPDGAKDIQFYCYVGSFGGEVLLLKLKIDKSYILQELKTHKFINQTTPVETKQKIYFMPSDNGRITSTNYTFYVIKDNENETYYKKYFPYFSGIGVSKDLNYILYYYINPDD